ncbi:MAG: hypothetical protein V1847_03410, partial [Candidatus Diapherotrites archaeon]
METLEQKNQTAFAQARERAIVSKQPSLRENRKNMKGNFAQGVARLLGKFDRSLSEVNEEHGVDFVQEVEQLKVK